MTISPAWECSHCGEWHDNEDDAIECCEPTIIEGWQCDSCGECYRLEENAKSCCAQSFICGGSSEQHTDAESASECCGIPFLTMPSLEDLEKAGQMRLIE
jgi:hypothetical protein